MDFKLGHYRHVDVAPQRNITRSSRADCQRVITRIPDLEGNAVVSCP
jgi:hypothetical protein